MHINAVANSFILLLFLRHDFYNINLKSNINYMETPGQHPPSANCWVRTCSITCHKGTEEGTSIVLPFL